MTTEQKIIKNKLGLLEVGGIEETDVLLPLSTAL